MKITMVMVMSVDGQITKGDDPQIYTWTSQEDQKHLERNTLRIVLTKYPSKYASETVPGMLEFSCESPKRLIHRLEKNGYTEMLLVGGAAVNGVFLVKADLVNELYLTIEPRIFGKGMPLVLIGQLDCQLELISIKQLNQQGTVLLHYGISN